MLDELLKEARGWLADCGFYRADLLSDHTLMVCVNQAYDGGWPEFVRADPDANERAVYSAILREHGMSMILRLYSGPDPTPTGDPGRIVL